MRLILCLLYLSISFSVSSNALNNLLKGKSGVPNVALPMSLLTPPLFYSELSIRTGRTSISMLPKMSTLIDTSTGKKITDGRQVFPNITFDWVQNKAGEIIPSVRHLVLSDNANWDYILGVGQLWPQTLGEQSSRVSMPFTLVEKNENCTHNGVLVFDIAATGGYFYFQVSSETCAYFKADFWGLGKATTTLAKLENEESLIANYAKEKKNRFPTKPIRMISENAKGIQINKLALASDIAPDDMTLYGVLLDKIHYVSDCKTRAGNYPFCEQLVLPSYSTAKSLFAAVSMFYLEQQYGDVFNQPISQWVEECAGKNWEGISFSHLLDMSTGNYNSAKYSEDEASPEKLTFFNAKSNGKRLTFACNHYSRKTKPGSTFVYHTSDTYLLGAGLTAYLKNKLGKNADLFDDVLYDKIFRPLLLSPVSAESRRSSDVSAQPYVGYGLFFTRDDLVKLSRFLSQQTRINSEHSLLAQEPLQAAMQQNPNNRGLTTDYSYIRYQHGFWARKVPNKTACKNSTWLAFMSGYGGINVALLAKSSIYYYISDSFHFDWSAAIPELEKLDLICASGT